MLEGVKFVTCKLCFTIDEDVSVVDAMEALLGKKNRILWCSSEVQYDFGIVCKSCLG